MEMKPIVYRGAKEIGAAVGISFKEIGGYVKTHGLPAFKYPGSRNWVALPEDLAEWVQGQRNSQLGPRSETPVNSK